LYEETETLSIENGGKEKEVRSRPWIQGSWFSTS